MKTTQKRKRLSGGEAFAGRRTGKTLPVWTRSAEKKRAHHASRILAPGTAQRPRATAQRSPAAGAHAPHRQAMAALPSRSSTTFSAHWSDVVDAARSAGIDDEHALVLLEELALRADEREVESVPRTGRLRRFLRRSHRMPRGVWRRLAGAYDAIASCGSVRYRSRCEAITPQACEPLASHSRIVLFERPNPSAPEASE